MDAKSINGILPEHASVKYNSVRRFRYRLLLFRRLPYLLKNKRAALETRVRTVCFVKWMVYFIGLCDLKASSLRI